MAEWQHWTVEEITLLRHMHAAGDTFTAIGEALGRARAGCISKARKLGLKKRRTGRHRQPVFAPVHRVIMESHADV